MNGEEMKRLIADDEDRVLLLRFPKGWGLWVDLGGALLDEAFRSDLVFFEMNQEFWQEGKAGLNTPSLDLAVAQLWGRIIRPLGKLRPKGGFSGGNSAPSLGLAPW